MFRSAYVSVYVAAVGSLEMSNSEWDAAQATPNADMLCASMHAISSDGYDNTIWGNCSAPATQSVVIGVKGAKLHASVPIVCMFHAVASGAVELRDNEIPANFVADPEDAEPSEDDEVYEEAALGYWFSSESEHHFL